MARHLLLVRHGSTGESYRRRYVGSTDVPLDGNGRRQAAALAALVGGRRPGKCYSSPLQRAMETAEAIVSPLELSVEVLPELREIDFGQWEGRTFEEIQESGPQDVNRWADLAPDFGFPGGESIRDFLSRVSGAVERMVGDEADAVVAVTHGGVIRAAICRLLGLDHRHYLAFDVRQGSVTVIELFDGKGVLAELNNQCCLEEQ